MKKLSYYMRSHLIYMAFPLLVLLGLGTWSSASGQLYVGLGGQAGFMNMANANAPVDFFNSKGFLIRRLREFHWPAGLIYSAAYKEDGLLLELSLNTKRHRTAAEFLGSGGNSIDRREHRFVIQSLSATVGGAVVDEPELQLYLCGSLDFGMMRYRTRTGNPETINRASFFTVSQQRFLGTTLSLRFTFRNGEDDFTHWTWAPYVQIPFGKFDFQRFNQTLNPFDWNQVPGESTARPINFGMSLSFDFDLIELIQ